MPQTVLVIDDDEIVRAAVAGMLENEGLSVVTHDSGFGFASAVRALQPALIVLDLGLPGMSGDAAAQGLREIAGRWDLEVAPIVVYSAAPQDELDARANALGVGAAISKSKGPAAVVRAAKRLLGLDAGRE